MPKVKPNSERSKEPEQATVYNQDQGGVRVTIQLYTPRGGVPIVVSLPYPCSWKGRLLPRIQTFVTDREGKVVAYLPPSAELKAFQPARESKGPISYLLECEPVGKLAFTVPQAREWKLSA